MDIIKLFIAILIITSSAAVLHIRNIASDMCDDCEDRQYKYEGRR